MNWHRSLVVCFGVSLIWIPYVALGETRTESSAKDGVQQQTGGTGKNCHYLKKTITLDELTSLAKDYQKTRREASKSMMCMLSEDPKLKDKRGYLEDSNMAEFSFGSRKQDGIPKDAAGRKTIFDALVSNSERKDFVPSTAAPYPAALPKSVDFSGFRYRPMPPPFLPRPGEVNDQRQTTMSPIMMIFHIIVNNNHTMSINCPEEEEDLRNQLVDAPEGAWKGINIEAVKNLFKMDKDLQINKDKIIGGGKTTTLSSAASPSVGSCTVKGSQSVPSTNNPLSSTSGSKMADQTTEHTDAPSVDHTEAPAGEHTTSCLDEPTTSVTPTTAPTVVPTAAPTVPPRSSPSLFEALIFGPTEFPSVEPTASVTDSSAPVTTVRTTVSATVAHSATPTTVVNTKAPTKLAVTESHTTVAHTVSPTTKAPTVALTTQMHTVGTTQPRIACQTTPHTVSMTTHPLTVAQTTQPHTVAQTTQPHTVAETTQPHTVAQTTQSITIVTTTQAQTVSPTTAAPTTSELTTVTTEPPDDLSDFEFESSSETADSSTPTVEPTTEDAGEEYDDVDIVSASRKKSRAHDFDLRSPEADKQNKSDAQASTTQSPAVSSTPTTQESSTLSRKEFPTIDGYLSFLKNKQDSSKLSPLEPKRPSIFTPFMFGRKEVFDPFTAIHDLFHSPIFGKPLNSTDKDSIPPPTGLFPSILFRKRRDMTSTVSPLNAKCA